ncbi:MAG: site-specific DNA-methyltransferase, partial [Balneolales bacterium]|nr:site-specific DNA-methyltransferase [Balneolales bacterium]
MSDKLDLQSPDFVRENVEKIAALFPNCVTESAEGKAIDFDQLRQELSNDIVEETKERYRLEWPGKKEAIVTSNIPTTKTLRPVREDSVNFDTTENLYIEGDNLEVLKLLQESYLGKIKMIYIDPPYNTGKDFVYKDNFTQDTESYKEESGQVDEYNRRLMVNPETAGRYHSDWLSMMYPRLKLARNLLKDDGVIFISIDDNEVHNLRKICDEIFGEVNFIADIIWEKRYGRSNDAKLMASTIDHILLYRKSESLQLLREVRTESANKAYSNPDNDPRGVWTSVSFVSQRTRDERPNLIYKIINPNTGKEFIHPTNSWKYTEEKYKEWLADNRFYWGKDGKQEFPRIKRFLSELDDGLVPVNLWKHQESGTGDEGTKEVNQLVGKSIFTYPKPTKLLIRALGLGLDLNSKDGIVLDFFSGSAGLGDAVVQMNSKDKGSRKYIMVQLPEATDEKSEAYKAGYKNICEIGKERIRRAGKAIIKEQTELINQKKSKLEKLLGKALIQENDEWVFPEGVVIDDTAKELLSDINDIQQKVHRLDIGFRVYRLDSSNMQDVYYKPHEYKQAELDLFADNI